MATVWDYKQASYSTEIFNIVQSELELIFKTDLINVEGSELDFNNCIDILAADNDYNFYGIAFRALKRFNKYFTIRYKHKDCKQSKTEYDKLLDPSLKLKSKYHVQVNDAGDFYVISTIPTNDIIDYLTINNLIINTNKDSSKYIVIPWLDLKTQGYNLKHYRIPKNK